MTEENLLKNRYKLDKILGRGGMAVVYQARDQMLERDAAIKVLKGEYASDPDFRERFRQEAKAAANLSHPNIVTVYDFDIDEERIFIVMEYVPGNDLNSIIKEKQRLTIPAGIDLMVKACKAIGYAHRAGLVHCDVKPHNFLVTPANQLKVTDFGIARALASINPEEESDVVWGSPQYFAPEQAAGGPPSPASDVYSLGVVMYQMLTGELPFTGKTSSELAQMHRYAKPVSPREINPGISKELEQVIMKVLAKEPSARYRTADQLGRVLQTLMSKKASPDKEKASTAPSQKASASLQKLPPQPGLTPAPSAGESSEISLSEIDWITLGLGLLAFTAVFGLIPFSIWVFSTFFPPVP